MANNCEFVPKESTAIDGDKWTCPGCGVSYEFIVLDESDKGQWVQTGEEDG